MALTTGNPNVGGTQVTNPAAFNTLGTPVINGAASVGLGWFDVGAFGFPSWRGALTPTGPFAGEFGTVFRVAAHVLSDQAFTLSELTVERSSTEQPVPTVLDGSFAPLGTEGLWGLWWGEDGVKGGSDDVLYNTPVAASSTLLNELFQVGFGTSFITPPIAWIQANFPGAPSDPQFYLDDYIATTAVMYPGGYRDTLSYNLRGSSASVTADIGANAVPAPQTATLALLALALMACMRVSKQPLPGASWRGRT